MLTAGVDLGTQSIRAVVVKDGAVLGRAACLATGQSAVLTEQVLDRALADAKTTRGELSRWFATGVGRHDVPHAHGCLTDVSAAARAGMALCRNARTVVDVGAEEARAIRINDAGKILDFAINEKCAAGAGVFAEAIARLLAVPLNELGPLSLQSTQAMPMNAQCVVFAESEAVSLLHANTPAADIARAVHDAIATRVIALVRKVGGGLPLALCGGLANNSGFVAAFRRGLGHDEVYILEPPEYAGALGAALAAADAA
jgi:benzoyl-CoA reductase subunit D